MKPIQFLLIFFFTIFQCKVDLHAQQGADAIINAGDIFKVSVSQPFSFGVYAQGAAGGDVILEPNGTRRLTGTLQSLNFGSAFHPLLVEVEAPQGSIVSILDNGGNILTGSNGGKMFLRMGNILPGNPFVINNEAGERNVISIGGVLTVGDAATTPPGNYSGQFFVSFIME